MYNKQIRVTDCFINAFDTVTLQLIITLHE